MPLPIDRSKEERDEATFKQVLALTMQNVSENQISKELNISRRQVRKIRNSDKFKAEIKEIGDQAVAVARENFKSRMHELEPLAYAALKKNLEDGKIEAVRTFIEVVGLKKPDEAKQQDSTIQILMPGVVNETIIPTTGTPVESEDDGNLQ